MGNFSEGGPTSNFSQRGDQIFGPGGGQGGAQYFFPMQQVQCQKTMKTSSVTKQFPMLALVGIRLAVFKNHFPSLQTGSAALGSLKPQRAKRAKFFFTLQKNVQPCFCQSNLLSWQNSLRLSETLASEESKIFSFTDVGGPKFAFIFLFCLKTWYTGNAANWQAGSAAGGSLKPQRAKRANFLKHHFIYQLKDQVMISAVAEIFFRLITLLLAK